MYIAFFGLKYSYFFDVFYDTDFNIDFSSSIQIDYCIYSYYYSFISFWAASFHCLSKDPHLSFPKLSKPKAGVAACYSKLLFSLLLDKFSESFFLFRPNLLTDLLPADFPSSLFYILTLFADCASSFIFWVFSFFCTF